MKSNKVFRTGGSAADSDDLRRGTKLPPIKKSGKERHTLYSEIGDDEEDIDYLASKRESVFDYMDDDEQ